MNDKPVSFVCPSCVERFADDGICPECNIALMPVNTIPCPECGSELPSDAKHCSYCGTALQNKCKNCGTILGAEDVFCSDCGHKNESTPVEFSKAKKATIDINCSGKELVDLMYDPVPLSVFHSKYGFLSTGPNSEEYNLAIEKGLNLAKEKPIIMRFNSYPRRWAILKPGKIRRFITMLIDCIGWIALFLGVLVLVIGNHKSGGLLRSVGLGADSIRGGFAFIWFILSYFVYTAGAEFLLGTTIGGLITGTRVVNDYGKSLTAWELFKRQFRRLFFPITVFMGALNDDHEIVVK